MWYPATHNDPGGMEPWAEERLEELESAVLSTTGTVILVSDKFPNQDDESTKAWHIIRQTLPNLRVRIVGGDGEDRVVCQENTEEWITAAIQKVVEKSRGTNDYKVLVKIIDDAAMQRIEHENKD